MGKRKHKRKFTREPQLSANSRAAMKRAKQDVVHRVVMIFLESKTRGDVYVNVKNCRWFHCCYPIDDRGQPKV